MKLPKDKAPRHTESLFKNGSLKDHLERTRLERTDVKENDSLTVSFAFKLDTTITVASPTPIRPIKYRTILLHAGDYEFFGLSDPEQAVSPARSPVKRPAFRARSPYGKVPIKTLNKGEHSQSAHSAVSDRAVGKAAKLPQEEQSDGAEDDIEDDGSYLAACGVSPKAAGTPMALVRSGSNYRKSAVFDT